MHNVVNSTVNVYIKKGITPLPSLFKGDSRDDLRLKAWEHHYKHRLTGVGRALARREVECKGTERWFVGRWKLVHALFHKHHAEWEPMRWEEGKTHSKKQQECAGFSHLQTAHQSQQCPKPMEAGLCPGQNSPVMEVDAFPSMLR